MSTQLNPYKIHWAIIQKEDQSCKFEFASTKERLLETLKAPFNSKAYIITDKQFGMIQNTYNGTPAKCPKPFTHFIVADNKGMLSTIPMTKQQFENPLIF